jgi:hypothetical protein
MRRMIGGCLCGAITYRCDAEPLLTAICHCRNCQKQTGTAFSLVVAVPKGALGIEGGTLKTFKDMGDSGKPVLRKFCGNCGTPIASQLDAMPELAFIKAGSLEDTSWLSPSMEIWCDSSQPWVKIDGTRQLVKRNPPLGG